MPLNILMRDFVPFRKAVQKQIDLYHNEGGKADFCCDFVDFSELSNITLKEGQNIQNYDIVFLLTDWLPILSKSGKLAPIDTFLKESPPPGWTDDWIKTLKDLEKGADGRTYGLPYHDGPEVFIYRQDLFSDPEEKKLFKKKQGRPLAPPDTWSEFLDVAKFFTRPEEDLFGTVVGAFPDGHNNVYDLLIQGWSRGGKLFDKNWKPKIAQEPFVAGLSFYADLINEYEVAPPESSSFDSVESGRFYSNGHAAMMWNWFGYAVMAEMPQQSEVVGDSQIGVIPKGEGKQGEHVSLDVHWFLGIPSSSSNKEEAYKFIRTATSPKGDKFTALEGGVGTRLSTWRDSRVQNEVKHYSKLKSVCQGIRTLPKIPQYPAINEALNKAVSSVMEGQLKPRKALEEASIDCEQILSEAGYYE